MATIVTSASTSETSNIFGKLFLLAVFFGLLALTLAMYYAKNTENMEDSRLRMEKSSGKNGPHANQKAREQAAEDYQKVKDELREWDRKPNKTPEDKDFIQKLRKALERLRLKKDFSGENHSQKPKGF